MPKLPVRAIVETESKSINSYWTQGARGVSDLSRSHISLWSFNAIHWLTNPIKVQIFQLPLSWYFVSDTRHRVTKKQWFIHRVVYENMNTGKNIWLFMHFLQSWTMNINYKNCSLHCHTLTQNNEEHWTRLSRKIDDKRPLWKCY